MRRRSIRCRCNTTARGSTAKSCAASASPMRPSPICRAGTMSSIAIRTPRVRSQSAWWANMLACPMPTNRSTRRWSTAGWRTASRSTSDGSTPRCSSRTMAILPRSSSPCTPFSSPAGSASAGPKARLPRSVSPASARCRSSAFAWGCRWPASKPRVRLVSRVPLRPNSALPASRWSASSPNG